jgi:hypothetical protein
MTCMNTVRNIRNKTLRPFDPLTRVFFTFLNMISAKAQSPNPPKSVRLWKYIHK